MNDKHHRYSVTVAWTGNTGAGTASYRGYERTYEIHRDGKPVIPGSSDPNFRGDGTRWNPEELLVASLSSCHKLWYLHLATVAAAFCASYCGPR
jgi:organic hydroperoxide reductase OsmC/OhrA